MGLANRRKLHWGAAAAACAIWPASAQEPPSVTTKISYGWASLYQAEGGMMQHLPPKTQVFVDLYACAPSRLKVEHSTGQTQRTADQLLVTSTTAMTSKNGDVEFTVIPISAADGGRPYMIAVGVGGTPQQSAAVRGLPVCDPPPASDEDIRRHFGTLADRVGFSFVGSSGKYVTDYQWLRRGEVLDGTYRKVGEADTVYHYMYVFDARSQRLVYLPMDGVGQASYISPPVASRTGALAYRADIARAQQAAAERRANGGGLLGTLAQVAGGITTAMDDNLFRAAVARNMPVLAPLANAAGGRPIDTSAATAAGGTSGGMLQPNLANADACPGFTEDNYTSMATADGPNMQLNTMCGQAYDLYASYKRAFEQGIAGTDRTYDAHRKAALVANSYFANNRASDTRHVLRDAR